MFELPKCMGSTVGVLAFAYVGELGSGSHVTIEVDGNVGWSCDGIE